MAKRTVFQKCLNGLNKSYRVMLFILILLLSCSHLLAFEVQIDENLDSYNKSQVVSGKFIATGSTTVGKLLERVSTNFKEMHSGFNLMILGGGSSAAPVSLMNKQTDIALMSRPMNQNELDKFKEKFGYPPLEIPIALDAIAIIVHKTNPIDEISISQLDGIFSTTRKCGSNKDINTWGELGVSDNKLKDTEIKLIGRTQASATSAYFKEKVLCGGDFKKKLVELKNAKEVIQVISDTPSAIGFSSVSLLTPNTKALKLKLKDDKEPIELIPENIYNKKYPLHRFLYIYVNKEPNSPINPAIKEFIAFLISKEGQKIVVEEGFLSINSKIAQRIKSSI